jgi:hypothetical protein
MRTHSLLSLMASCLLVFSACSSDSDDPKSRTYSGAGGSRAGSAGGGVANDGSSGDRGAGTGGTAGSGESGPAGAGSGSTGGAGTSGSAGFQSGGAGDPGECASDVWSTLEACGWPGPANTGPKLAQCPNGLLSDLGSSSMPTIELDQDGALVECANVRGTLHVTAKNVTIRNTRVAYDSGKKGEAANGTAAIMLDDGASATIEQVQIDGLQGAHACIWHQGASMTVRGVDCHGVDDGIFTWASSSSAGDEFTIEDSYFHDLTPLTANGHMDGFQTEGASNGVIRHNTYAMSAEGTSALAIWNSLKDTSDILVQNNLLAGGGAAVYAEDYDPSEQSPEGGFSVTKVTFEDNVFSTHVSPCVGKYFVWFSRPEYAYGGGPTDGWQRTGNTVLETGENVDAGNPHVDGQLCH